MAIKNSKIYFKNTFGNEIQEFKPINEHKVGMYHCGPTVYNQAHIGNISAYIFADILRRLFETQDYQVTQVINITDVGHLTDDQDDGADKIEEASKKQNLTAVEISRKYTELFLQDLQKLNIETNKIIFPRATDHITEQIELIKKIEAAGLTYQTSDGIYFDTSLYENYGQLGNIDLKNLQEGARVSINSEKKNPTDFALWKFSPKEEKRQQEWESPWGIGFPGWHIECSAMSEKYLGKNFDIHTGGIEHIAIHHNNEMAQSESANHERQANYWLHTNHITLDGQKMSKSLGNVLYLDDLIKSDINPMSFRYWYLTSKYNTPANFSMESVKASQTALFKIVNFISSSGVLDSDSEKAASKKWFRLLKIINKSSSSEKIDQKYYSAILAELNHDLNTPKAIALIWELIKDDSISQDKKVWTIIEADKILGLNLKVLATNQPRLGDQQILNSETQIPTQIVEMAKERQLARENKNFTEADRLRSEISEAGYEIIDQTDNKQSNFIILKK